MPPFVVATFTWGPDSIGSSSIIMSLMTPSTNVAEGFSASPVLSIRTCAYRDVDAICLAISTANPKLSQRDHACEKRLVNSPHHLNLFLDSNLPEMSTQSAPELYEDSRKARWGHKTTFLAPLGVWPNLRTERGEVIVVTAHQPIGCDSQWCAAHPTSRRVDTCFVSKRRYESHHLKGGYCTNL
jgi:hypothetical protein